MPSGTATGPSPSRARSSSSRSSSTRCSARARERRDEMTEAPHLLAAEEISKYYGNVVALRDVSLHVDAGEVTCILGDNGAGKSSLIKILSGVHTQDEGRLLVDGEEVSFTSPRHARSR